MDTITSWGGGLFGFFVLVVTVVGAWKAFAKAGQPGLFAIIPIINILAIMKIAGKPWWWALLLLIPIVQLFVIFIVMSNVASAYGKGLGFTLGLIFLAPLFWCILGFGDARYQGAR